MSAAAVVAEAAVVERPILFSAPMVRALLAGTKTQTRRVAKLHAHDGVQLDHSPWRLCDANRDGTFTWQHRTDIRRVIVETCPYGTPGDRLWVKETWHPSARIGADCVEIEYLADESRRELVPPGEFMWKRWDDKWIHGGWRPSIFMSRWMSRITLEVTDVRVEPVQAISEEDARAEGAVYHNGHGVGHSGWRHDPAHGYVYESARASFAALWQAINGTKSPWVSNPWIWAVSFKVLP